MKRKIIKRLAIIPAKGNSIRIKRKNIKLFFKKPIINYTIDSALKSKLFNRIHVSTDSKIIEKIVKKKGIITDFYRPKSLSGNKTPLIKVYEYVVNRYRKLNLDFDEIWALMPCSPLINQSDLKKVSIFSKKMRQKKPIMSVSKFKSPIDWAYKINKNNVLKPVKSKYLMYRSQDLPERYYETGQFVVYPGKYFKKNIKKNTEYQAYILPILKSIDIDDIEDWKLAEVIYKNLKKI